MKLRFTALALGALSFCFSPARAADTVSAPKIIVRATKLFDPVAGRMIDHPVIIVAGNKIESLSNGEAASIPGATVIDLGDAALLPGFIDVHTHLTMNAGGGGYEGFGISTPRAALIGAKNARLTLLAGFTTVRNVGAEGYTDVALRELFLNRSSPAMDDGSANNWIQILDHVLNLPVTTAVPGHFELGTRADLTRFRDYLLTGVVRHRRCRRRRKRYSTSKEQVTGDQAGIEAPINASAHASLGQPPNESIFCT